MKIHSRKNSIPIILALVLAADPLLAQASSCFAYRTKGGDAFQIACYQDAAACTDVKTDYQRNPSVEVMGCSSQIYCFTYNQGGKSSACYLDSNQCVTQRNLLAGSSGNVGLCVANTTAGAPRVQLSQGTPPATSTTPRNVDGQWENTASASTPRNIGSQRDNAASASTATRAKKSIGQVPGHRQWHTCHPPNLGYPTADRWQRGRDFCYG